MTPSTKASYVDEQSSCDTELVVVGKDEEFTNVMGVVEFLESDRLREPSVYLLSHTHVTVKCCNAVQQDPSNCTTAIPEIPFPDLGLVDCDDKKFELECSVNSLDEKYECIVKLSDSQVLGDPRLKYSIHSCSASVPGSNKIPLVINSPNGPQSSPALEVSPVCVQNPAADASRTVYFFSAPYFQFDGHSPGPVDQHDVSISCSVEVFEASTRPNDKPPAC